MAAIIGVHGIAQEYKGPHSLANLWLPSLLDGVKFAGGSLAAEAFAMAFYGDMFRTPDAMAGGFPPLEANDLDEPDDAVLLDLLWREAARVEPDRVPNPEDDETMAGAPRSVQRALNALSASAFFAGCAERVMIGTVKQVRLYFTDPVVRARAVNSVSDVITDETRVVIGHSLGSVVAYEALAANPEWPVHTLITLGSPLGIRNLIFDRLESPAVDGRRARPGGLRAWVNVAAAGDIVALEKHLARRFDGVTDVEIDTGPKAHDVSPYLTHRKVGSAIMAGLA